MPLSMSTMKGEPIFRWAEKNINGLRIATVEPSLCVGHGWQRSGTHRHHDVAYVDDLLFATTSESALKTQW